MYTEIYRILLGEISKDLSKRSFSTSQKLSIVKMSILSNCIYRFNTISIKNQAGFLIEFGK